MISKKSLNISQKIYTASWSIDPVAKGEKNKPIELSDYIQACKEYLNTKEIITTQMIANQLEYLKQDGKLKIHLPEGYRCCVTVIPFSNAGFPLDEESIKSGKHLKFMILDKNGLVEPGFYKSKNTVFSILPNIIQKELTILIEKYDSKEMYDISDKDRERIISKFKSVLEKAQQIFNT